MATSENRFLIFVKVFSRRKYADKMLAGELHAGRLNGFRETEDPVRSDKFEGTILWEGGKLTLQVGDGEPWIVPPDDLAGPIERRSRLLDNLNVFCMTAFQSGLGPWPSWQLIDQVMKQIPKSLPSCSNFGEHAVVITDAKEFLRRVALAAKRKNWPMCSSHVEYYNSYPLDVAFGAGQSFRPAFLKRKKYQLEREFRVAINTGSIGDNPVTLDIGDIRDIAWYTKVQGLGTLKCQITGDCLLCGRNSCESYRPQPGEHANYKRSEYHELHDFSCETCGCFSVTTQAAKVLEKHGASGIIFLGLTPRWHPLIGRHIVDSDLVEESVRSSTPFR